MPQEEHKPAPPYHANVIGGQEVTKAAQHGFVATGVVHDFRGVNFKMCGHSGKAEEYRGPSGVVKVCHTCLAQYNR
jgi:hypothetical protein